MSKLYNLMAGLVVALAACGLAWAVVADIMSSTLRSESPGLALQWRPNDARALTLAAEAAFDQAQEPDDLRQAGDLARRAVLQGPLEAAAFRILALEAEGAGQSTRASMLMRFVGARTLRDTLSQVWLFGEATSAGDHVAAARRADTILRRRPDFQEILFPAMILELQEPGAADAYARVLSRSPEWRASFLTSFAREAPDARIAIGVFSALARSPQPPSSEETQAIVARLLSENEAHLARLTWAQLEQLVAEPSPIYDPGFSRLKGAGPFNWVMRGDGDALAEFSEAPDGGAALHAQFAAGPAQVIAEQLLVLSPGSYRLTGQVKVESAFDAEPAAWRLVCSQSGVDLGRAERRGDAGSDWRSFELVFVVPGQGCAAQALQLVTEPSLETSVSHAWYRGLALERAASAT